MWWAEKGKEIRSAARMTLKAEIGAPRGRSPPALCGFKLQEYGHGNLGPNAASTRTTSVGPEKRLLECKEHSLGAGKRPGADALRETGQGQDTRSGLTTQPRDEDDEFIPLQWIGPSSPAP